jgi:hypothetical protein
MNKDNVPPMELIRQAIAKLRSPYDYRKTRCVVDKIARKHQEHPHGKSKPIK